MKRDMSDNDMRSVAGNGLLNEERRRAILEML